MKCEICNLEFDNFNMLSKHIKSHGYTSEQYYLAFCGCVGTCAVCKSATSYKGLKLGYNKYCSVECSGKSVSKLEKYKETCISKYGTDNAIKNTAVLEKRVVTYMNKYNSTHPMKTTSIKEKHKHTLQTKYSVDSVFNIPHVIDKIHKTNIDRYGHENPVKSEIIKSKLSDIMLTRSIDIIENSNNKRINTYRTKYNVDNIMQCNHIKAKMIDTFVSKYNVTNPFKMDSVKQKTKSTLMNKYGVDTPMKSTELHNNQMTTMMKLYGVNHPSQSTNLMKRKIQAQHSNMLVELNNRLVKYNCVACSYNGKQDGFIYRCDNCGNTCNESYQFVNIVRLARNTTPCIHCVPKNPPYSHTEREFSNWVCGNISCDYKLNVRDVIDGELDLYIPSMKIAFEFNGIYYHSELFKLNDYHLNKTNKCNALGIRLIHIWEDDWLYKKDIVKSIVLSIINKTNGIYARKCVIKPVSSIDSNNFLESNHLQGSCNASSRIGLYVNDELVSLMTFGKSRFESNVIELLRYCNKLNTTVIGGASKLFAYYVKEHNTDSIVSYADRSRSNGNMYEKIGFEFVSYTPPSYSYIENGIRNNRMNYQKHKLIKRGFVGNTEHEMMTNAGIYRIYDCGNYKFKWTRK